jgi:DNA uptake protein ComE-like DNA-binding protein
MTLTVRQFRGLCKPRGFVLITVVWIVIALTAVVLVLCREMMVESLTARQHLAQAKADAAETGAEQFVMSIVEQELLTPGYKDQTIWQQRQIGECYFWVLAPNFDGGGACDESLMKFGLTDEASKLDINSATETMIECLPGIDYNPSIAAAIADWRDPDDTVTENINTGAEGAESEYYQATFGYHAKNAPFESLEELRLVSGLTDPTIADPLFYGADANHNTVIDSNESASADTGMTFETTMRGIMPYVTVYGYQATNPPEISTTTDSLGNVVIATTTPTTIDEITFRTPIDVNAGLGSTGTADTATLTLLQELLNDYLPAKASAIMTATRAKIAPTATGGGRGGGGGTTATATPFNSIWEWIVTMNTNAQIQLDSTDLSTVTADGTPLFNLLTCIPKTTTTNANNAATPATPATITPTETNPTGAPPTTKFAKLNVNTASLQALMCLPGFTQEDAQAIIDYREANLINQATQDPLQVPNISWLLDAIDPQLLLGITANSPTAPTQADQQAGSWITGSSTVFSADIVTVSQDGRAFKRVKIVVDASSGTPTIVYRRDLTDAGWPMDPAIRTALRKGLPLDTVTGTGSASSGRLTFSP